MGTDEAQVVREQDRGHSSRVSLGKNGNGNVGKGEIDVSSQTDRTSFSTLIWYSVEDEITLYIYFVRPPGSRQ